MGYPLTIEQDPSADWTERNPVLPQFCFGYETDTGKMKLGDGSTAWNDLGYFNPTGETGVDGVDGEDGVSFIWKAGGWDAETAYVVNDVVENNGSSYIAIANNTDSEPPSADWDLMAAKGEDA